MGPRAGLGEIALPAVQPGSSIMPGKVNPSIPEMVNQVCFQVTGCDATVSAAAEAGQLELNVMMPVIAWNALHASTILTNAMNSPAHALRGRDRGGAGTRTRAAGSQHRRGNGIESVHRVRATAEIAKESVRTGRPIRDIVLERRLLDAAQLDRILAADAMTRPGIAGTETKRP